MRIHTDDLTHLDLTKAAQHAGVVLQRRTNHNSRKRDYAFEVALSGSSNRKAQSGGWDAATWDEWGMFLGYLFNADPSMIAGPYTSGSMFHHTTNDRFNGTPFTKHAQHKWVYHHSLNADLCKCGARVNRGE